MSQSLAQTASDSIPKFDPKVKSALNMSDQMAYQAALRYSDLQIAKIKLYDLMVRNPEDLRYMEALGSLYFEAGQNASAALVAMDLLKINDKTQGHWKLLPMLWSNWALLIEHYLIMKVCTC